MKFVSITAQVFLLCLLSIGGGCESLPFLPKSKPKVDNDLNASMCIRYSPEEIDILPLTEFVSIGDAQERTKINAYVSLLDSFGCQIKSPGVFRFELYEYVQRSAEPKGKRISIWPDIDLTDVVKNYQHWRDFLRAYEFDLDFEPVRNETYVLQVTCLCPSGRRLAGELILKWPK